MRIRVCAQFARGELDMNDILEHKGYKGTGEY